MMTAMAYENKLQKQIIKTEEITKPLFIFLVILVAFIAKVVLTFILPDKYLYDSNGIIEYAYGINAEFADKSYMFAANFYRLFCKLFHITDAKTGSIIVGVISNLILIKVLRMIIPQKIPLKDAILVLLTVFLLNIYVFNISKDFIQFLFDIVILLVIFKVKKIHKMIPFCLLSFIIFGMVFRSYLLIVGFLFAYFSFMNKHIKNKNIIFLVTVFLFFIVALCLFENNRNLFEVVFNSGVAVNVGRIDSVDAQTIIVPLINGDGYWASIANYFINVFRLLFPIELLFDLKISYVFFFLFNIWWFVLLVVNRKMISKNIKLKETVYLFFSFFLTSALFEPDFGSFLRHLIPICFLTIICVLFKNKKPKRTRKSIGYHCQRYIFLFLHKKTKEPTIK